MSIILSVILKFITKPKVYKPLLIGLVILAFLWLLNDRNEQKDRADRQSNNVTALMKDSSVYINKYNQLVVEKDALNMTFNEFKNSKSKEIDFMKKQLKADGIEINRLHTVIAGNVGTVDTGSTQLTLNPVYIDTTSHKIDSLRHGHWCDAWTCVNFALTPKYKLNFKIITHDTLFVAIYNYKDTTFWTKVLPDKWVFWQDWKYGGSANLTRPNSYVSLQPIIFQKR